MATCYCTGACRTGAGCPATIQRAPAWVWPHPQIKPSPAPQVGCAVRAPLTEEQVRRIIREEIARFARNLGEELKRGISGGGK